MPQRSQRLTVVADLDGTLVDRDRCVASAGDLDALIRNAGGTLAIATSRPPQAVQRLVSGVIRFPLYAVCNDGAVAVRLDSGTVECLFENNLPSASPNLFKMLSTIIREDVWLFFLGGADMHQIGISGPTGRRLSDLLSRLEPFLEGRETSLLSIDAVMAECKSGNVRSVSWLGGSSEARRKGDILRKLIQSTSSELMVLEYAERRTVDLCWIDLVSPQCTKGNALSKLLSILNLPNPTYALGDGDNDVSMFQIASVSLCPTWASPAAREAASTCLYASNVEGFVAAAVEILQQSLVEGEHG